MPAAAVISIRKPQEGAVNQSKLVLDRWLQWSVPSVLSVLQGCMPGRAADFGCWCMCIIGHAWSRQARQDPVEVCKYFWQKACQEELLSLNILEVSPLLGNPSLACEPATWPATVRARCMAKISKSHTCSFRDASRRSDKQHSQIPCCQMNRFYILVQRINAYQPRYNFWCRKMTLVSQLLDKRVWYFLLLARLAKIWASNPGERHLRTHCLPASYSCLF